MKLCLKKENDYPDNGAYGIYLDKDIDADDE